MKVAFLILLIFIFSFTSFSYHSQEGNDSFNRPSVSPNYSQIVQDFRDIAQQNPGIAFRLMNGLHLKLGLPTEVVNAQQLYQSLTKTPLLERLEPSELQRLSVAGARNRPRTSLFPGQPQLPPQVPNPSPGFEPQPSAPQPNGHSPSNEAGIFRSGMSVYDDRLKAGQQGPMTCWAFGFSVALRLALMSQPVGGNQFNKTSYGVCLGDLNRAEKLSPSSNTYRTAELEWNIDSSSCEENSRVLASQNENRLQQILQQTAGLERRLATFTGGGGADFYQTVRFAKNLGIDRMAFFKVVRGQNGNDAAGAVRRIMEGMLLGVRFEGFFNRSHAMAIIGVDVATNSVWVTDSAHGGRVRKISLTRGAHIDAMVAVARPDSPMAVQWLQQQN